MNKLLWLVLMFSSSAFAQNKYSQYRLLSIEDFNISYAQFDHQRDPYLPHYDGQWAYRARADFNVAIMHTLYWHNSVHTEALKSGPVKTVGWHWILGLRLNKYMDLFHEHHSRHVMDEDPPVRYDGDTTGVFPVEDSYGLKFKIVEDGSPKRSLGDWFFK